MVKDAEIKDRCPRCGKDNIVTDSNTAEKFCGKCGFVMGDQAVESGPEWRSFSKEEIGRASCRERVLRLV